MAKAPCGSHCPLVAGGATAAHKRTHAILKTLGSWNSCACLLREQYKLKCILNFLGEQVVAHVSWRIIDLTMLCLVSRRKYWF